MKPQSLFITTIVFLAIVIVFGIFAAVFNSTAWFAVNLLCAFPMLLFFAGGSFFLWLHLAKMERIEKDKELYELRKRVKGTQ